MFGLRKQIDALAGEAEETLAEARSVARLLAVVVLATAALSLITFLMVLDHE